MNAIEKYYKYSLLDNLCSEYKTLWQRAKYNKEDLLRLSLCQQSIPHVVTYAYNKKGLTKSFLLSEFKDYINGYTVHDADDVKGYTYGLYVDFDYDNELILDKDVSSVMWTIGATLVAPETKAPIVYISNNSNVHLVCDGFNSVRVYLFDKSTLTLEDIDENSIVTIYKYSENAKVVRSKYCLSPNVKEFVKQLKL